MVTFTPEQVRFRDDLRAFFAEERVQRLRREVATAAPRAALDTRAVHRLLGARGWLAPNWPTRYGGLGRSAIESAILHQELVRHGLPDLIYVVSISYVGNFLLLAASEELKQRYLPRMAAGELSSCTLYSEPGVGSDLGSLGCRAKPYRGGYRLSGVKVYSQATEFAEYALVAARTTDSEPVRQHGITLFWVPLHAPGVRVTPVPNISDQPFNLVTLDEVEVPEDHVVGPPDEGWPLLTTALAMERTGLEAHLKMRSWLDATLARAEELGRLDDPLVADALVSLGSQVAAGGALAWDMCERQARQEIDETGAAMSKWYNTELGRPIARLAMDLDGLGGALSRWDGAAPAGGQPEAWYRECPGLTLSAGTSEIMLYAISTSHLRVNRPEATIAALPDPHADFRRRLRGFVTTAFPATAGREDEHPLGAARNGRADPERAARQWRALAKSTVVRLTLPPAAGGLGMDLAGSLVAVEELGRALVRAPYLSTVGVAELIAESGVDGPLWPLVADVVKGTRTIGFACEPNAPGLAPRLTAATSGYRLSGSVEVLPYADRVERLAVPADGDDGPVLVLVARQPSVRISRRDDVSRGDLYRVEFTQSDVEATAVLCPRPSVAFDALLSVLHLRQSAYLLGLAGRAFELTVEYARQRHQFGQPIATFQHISFRLAALAARLKAAKVLLCEVAARRDGPASPGPEAPEVRPAAVLALAAELARDVTAEAMQVHGAGGYTEDAEIQRYYRQAAVESALFGPPQRLRASC